MNGRRLFERGTRSVPCVDGTIGESVLFCPDLCPVVVLNFGI